MKRLYKQLCWQEKATYTALLFFVVAALSWWRLGIIALILLTTASVVKMATMKQFGNHSLQRGQTIMLWLMIAYWALYTASALYSHNTAEGWATVGIKLSFVLLPALVLCSDTAYLDRRRLRAVFYVMTATIVARFFVCLATAAIRYLTGTPLDIVTDWQIDPLGLHHNYLALYIVTAFGFIYYEIVRQWGKQRTKWRWSIIGVCVVLLVYLLVSQSRSGLVALALLIAACLIHLIFFKRKWKAAVAVVALCGVFTGTVLVVMPDLASRLAYTFTEMANGRPGDDRPILIRCGLETAKGHLIFGHGSGDYMEPLLQEYQRQEFLKGVEHEYGTHNQYIETLLETGLIGVALLLAMLVAPLIGAMTKQRRNLLAVLVVVGIMSEIFFESMLNRQMGVQFVSFFYCMIILMLRTDTKRCG